jgi:C4-dicarboxylate transporter, DctQ subunit
MSRAAKLVESCAMGLAYVAVLAAFLLTAVVTYSVGARYVFNAPQIWADELATYCLLVMVFFGLAHTLLTDGHVRADFVVERLSATARWYFNLFSHVVASLFAAVLLLGALSAVANFVNRNTHSSDGMQIPLAIPASVMIVGCALFLAAAVTRTLQMLLSARDKAR